MVALIFRFLVVAIIFSPTVRIKKLKIPYTQHEFLALNMYLSSFSKKTNAKIYICCMLAQCYSPWKVNVMEYKQRLRAK